jgi:hypothetical protein
LVVIFELPIPALYTYTSPALVGLEDVPGMPVRGGVEVPSARSRCSRADSNRLQRRIAVSVGEAAMDGFTGAAVESLVALKKQAATW